MLADLKHFYLNPPSLSGGNKSSLGGRCTPRARGSCGASVGQRGRDEPRGGCSCPLHAGLEVPHFPQLQDSKEGFQPF